MDEIFDVTNCTMCAHHCPIDKTSCRRGNDYAAWVYAKKEELREKAQQRDTALDDGQS